MPDDVQRYDHVPDTGNPITRRLLELIEPGATVLEFGPATGQLTRLLSEEMGCAVYIVEIAPDGFEQALRFARDGLLGDLETTDWEARFAGVTFDYALFGDVLEHLRDPQAVLRRLAGLLKPGAQVLATIPNVAYAGVILSLLQNRFEYRPLGIIDDTHLRFFTGHSIRALFETCGYQVDLLEGYANQLGHSEFAAYGGVLPESLEREVLEQPHTRIYHYLVAARHGTGARATGGADAAVEATADGARTASDVPPDAVVTPDQLGRVIRYYEGRIHDLEDYQDTLSQDRTAHVLALNAVLASPFWRATQPLRALLGRSRGAEAGGKPAPASPAAARDLPAVRQRISFIIPTLNGGAELERLVACLLAQQGFAGVEVVVVDSGSTDHSHETAAGMGAKLVTLPAEEFAHGHARNLGAAQATGEVLVFTTQDALPPDTGWARRLADPLVNSRAVAATGAQCPRPDATLFARVAIRTHNLHVGLAGEDRVTRHNAGMDDLAIIRNAHLDNVNCAILRWVFEEYRFRLDFLEDLDLGVRIFRDGHTLAMQGSVAVVHSHDRSLLYTLKRGIKDQASLLKVLPGLVPPTEEAGALVAEAMNGWRQVCDAIEALESVPMEETNVEAFCDAFYGQLRQMPEVRMQPGGPLPSTGETEVDQVLAMLQAQAPPQGVHLAQMKPVIIAYWLGGLRPLLLDEADEITAKLRLELADSLRQQYVNMLGSRIGAYVQRNPEADDVLAEVAALLRGGV